MTEDTALALEEILKLNTSARIEIQVLTELLIESGVLTNEQLLAKRTVLREQEGFKDDLVKRALAGTLPKC